MRSLVPWCCPLLMIKTGHYLSGIELHPRGLRAWYWNYGPWSCVHGGNMKDKDYILATNLTKIRVLNSVTRNLFVDSIIKKEELQILLLMFQRWEAKIVLKI